MDDVADVNASGGSAASRLSPIGPGDAGAGAEAFQAPVGSDGGDKFSALMKEGPAGAKSAESPMSLFQQGAGKAAPTPEAYAAQANDSADKLQQMINAIKQQPDLDLSKSLSPDKQQDLQKALFSLQTNLQKASKPVGMNYEPPPTSSDMMSAIKKFVGSLESAQDQFRNVGDAVNKQGKTMNPTALLKSMNNSKVASLQIQYMVGILSQSVSGLKSLMSVQL